MMKLLCIIVIAVVLRYPGRSQPVQPSATTEELQFLRFMLMSVGSIDHDPDAVRGYKEALVKQFGLNPQESEVINTAGQELATALRQIRQASIAIRTGRSSLTAADSAALAKLVEQREQKLQLLANRILNQVRPETAMRLRVPGRIVSTRKRP